MCWVDPLEILWSSAISLMPTRKFSGTVFLTISMFPLLTDVDGQLAWGKFSMTELKLFSTKSLERFRYIYHSSLTVSSALSSVYIKYWSITFLPKRDLENPIRIVRTPNAAIWLNYLPSLKWWFSRFRIIFHMLICVNFDNFCIIK